MKEMTWSEYIAMYAAIVATVVGVIQILNYLRASRNKLIVKIANGLNNDAFEVIGGSPEQVWIEVINDSANARFIRVPYFQVYKSWISKEIFQLVGHDGHKYPLRLDPGDEHIFKTTLDQFAATASKLNAKKVRAVAIDTLGKRYYSAWMQSA